MTGRGWTRYVAIGGSFTEGMCHEDAARPGGYAGCADRLAPAPPVSRRQAAAANAPWARRYVAPWVRRRLRGSPPATASNPRDPT